MKRTSRPSAHSLEVGAVVAEADDNGASVEPTQRLQQHLDALVLDELSVVDDRRSVAFEELGEAQRVAFVRKPFVRVPGIRRIEPRLRKDPGECVGLLRWPPELDVDPGRNLVDTLHDPADLAHHAANVFGADHRGRRARENLATPR